MYAKVWIFTDDHRLIASINKLEEYSAEFVPELQRDKTIFVTRHNFRFKITTGDEAEKENDCI